MSTPALIGRMSRAKKVLIRLGKLVRENSCPLSRKTVFITGSLIEWKITEYSSELT